VFAAVLWLMISGAGAQAAVPRPDVDAAVSAIQARLIAWRRDIHANPELGNRETRTADLVARHLTGLGLEVRAGIAHTGVIGVLQGGQPGPVVALRADMDALPVTEATGLPFASTVRAIYNGQETGVMHACGHDAHVAILMAAAEVLTGLKEQIAGTVLFVFQPAEEGPPPGERGGAELMLEEGAFRPLRPEAIFGLHVTSSQATGTLAYRSGPAMASADRFEIVVRGRQTHGSRPWSGVDPVTVASQIVLALQTISSRQVDVTRAPSVISVGSIHGGIRNNIIPESVELIGTIRTFSEPMRRDIHRRIEQTARSIAASAGAEAEIEIGQGVPVTVNDPELTRRMLPTLEAVPGVSRLLESTLVTGAEDFSFFANEVPGLYVFLGVTPYGQNPATAPANHSPGFFVDESALPIGVKTMSYLALDFLASGGTAVGR
jgi:amidohydrolase